MKTFIESAVNNSAKNYLYHNAIFRYYIGKENNRDTGNPLFLSDDTINLIRKKWTEEKEDIWNCWLPDWYRFFLEEGITHQRSEEEDKKILILSRIEYLYPLVDHRVSYDFMNQKNLTPAMKSALFCF